MNYQSITDFATKNSISLSTKNINDILKYKNNINELTNDALKTILGSKKYEKHQSAFTEFVSSNCSTSSTESPTESQTESQIDSPTESLVNSPTESQIDSPVKDILKELEDIEKNFEKNFDYEGYKRRISNTTALEKAIEEKDKLILEKDKLIQEKDTIIKCQLETIQKLIKSHENLWPHKFDTQNIQTNGSNLNGSTQSNLQVSQSQTQTGEIIVERHTDEYIKVYGKTYPYKELIKQAGGSFVKDGEVPLWIVPNYKLDSLKKIFEDSNVIAKYNV
jgi:hypothetical protein